MYLKRPEIVSIVRKLWSHQAHGIEVVSLGTHQFGVIGVNRGQYRATGRLNADPQSSRLIQAIKTCTAYTLALLNVFMV